MKAKSEMMAEDNSCSQDIIRAVRREERAVVIELSGEIDMQCSVRIRNKFIELLRDKPPLLVVNMTKVEFMDSSGLGTLVEALKWCRQNNGQLKLAGLTQGVRNVFEISRLESIFKIYDTETEALSE
jgi:anti-sigma B factor antagonist